MNESERGAALLEVLIAIALTAMLAGAAGGIVRFGLATIERAGAASERGAEVLTRRRGVVEMLARVERAAPGAAAFEGAAESLTWRGVIIGPAGEWRSGIWRLSGAGLTLSRCAGFEDPCTEDETAIAGPDARFAYAGADGEWRDAWPKGAAPALIRLTLTGAGTEDPAEIIVAPRVNGGFR